MRTSCLHYKTEERCENLYLPDKKGTVRKIHSVLTYEAENKRLGCINRDNNAVNNMIKIVKSYLKDKTRPERYCRGYKIPEQQKRTTAKAGKCLVVPYPEKRRNQLGGKSC